MAAKDVLDLTGDGWCLIGESDSVSGGKIRVPTALPVHALQALHENGLVPDPLYRFNEDELRWVALREWTFERQFDVQDSMLAAAQVDLLLSGVDTVAGVCLNSQTVISTDNAFREYRVPAKSLLRSGSNTISIIIQPAITEAAARADAYPYDVPAQQGPGMAPHLNRLRKPGCDFGWDWGPCFAPSGVCGPVQLIAYSRPHITGVTTRQRWQADGRIELEVIAALHTAAPGDSGVLEVSLPSCNVAASTPVSFATRGAHQASVRVLLEPDVKLWWPLGYGEPHMHDLQVDFRQAAANGSGDAASSVRKRVGFKRVRLVRQPLAGGYEGETFFFEVNSAPIFIKGSNVIPSSVFRSNETPELERAMIRDAVAVTMNTIRVWGGGHYPSDALMEACDEAGVLVWLELIFGCALYPRDTAFLKNVAEEVRQQMFRLAGHASVLVLGGNNEVENAFEWFEPSRSISNLYAVDYSELFVDTVLPALAATGPDIYLDSSPSNGLFSTDPYVKRWGNTQDPSRGDVHYYNYKADALSPDTYPRAKFVSEFGHQSFPSFHAYSKETAPEDWSWNSAMSQHRQRHPDGQQELLEQLQRHFALGNALEATELGFRRWIYLTQTHQALAYDTAVRHWRRIKHQPDARTMGVLYWQHQDIWAGPSWSGINHDGSWKLLHYAAARFFAPLAVSAQLDSAKGVAHVHITSDVPAPVAGEVSVEVVAWSATEAQHSPERHTFSLSALGSEVVCTLDLASLLQPSQLERTDAFLRFTATAKPDDDGAAPSGGGSGGYASTTELYLSPFKQAAMVDPQLSATKFKQASEKEVSFKVHAKAVAAGIACDTPLAGRFSDNGVLVLPWAPVTLTFHAAEAITASDLQQSLSLMSIWAPPGGDE